jgi:hypothetical protein
VAAALLFSPRRHLLSGKMKHLVSRFTPLGVAAVALVSIAHAQTFVDNLNGTHPSSTFTTVTDGTNAITDFGWISTTGVPRVFGQTGGTANDVVIETNPFDNYGLQFNTTSTPLLPNSTYTLSVRMGFVSGSGDGGSASYRIRLGTTTGGTNFSPLIADTPSAVIGTITRTPSSNTFEASIGADINSSDLVSINFTTGATVGSDTIAVLLEQFSSSNTPGADYFGFDNVTVSFVASAIPEPSTYATIFGAGVLALAAARRRRAGVPAGLE